MKSNYFRQEDYVAACRDRMTINLSNVILDICEDMHIDITIGTVIHRDRTDFSLINRPKLKSPQAEVNYSVLVYILSLI
jgi:hypothetical protein